MSTDRRGGFGPGVVAGLVIGLVAAALAAALTGAFDGEDEGEAIVEALETVEGNYFEAVDPAKLEDSSIQGMVRELRKRYDDRFSHYFTQDQLELFEAATSGRFSGVGLTVNEVAKGLRVADVLPDSPAERARIREGDVIVAVDGESIAGVPSDVSTARIKGPKGTEVELGLVPAGGGNRRELVVERAEVRLPAVESELRRVDRRQVAYVDFQTFSEGAHGELRETIERLYRDGAEGLVLDLRANGGGLLNEAVLSTSVFVEDGTVVSTDSRTQGERDYKAVGDAIDPRPTVVLVNRDTASAAEILAAALKSNDLATVVGTRTFGKGSFQEVIRLDRGGALDLTVGEYLTADGDSLAGEGVKPEVRTEDDRSTRREDEALERALEVLRQQL
ncbi:MAG: S41 family peptidase [Solirubrobacterales bacterium]